MNILIVHNIYSKVGGEEKVVEFQKQLLESKGHSVQVYYRNYNEMNSWSLGKAGGLFTSIYNPRSIKEIKKIIKEFKPQIAILHNLFPIISPAIIKTLKKNGVKTYQIVHNYRLLCPIGIFFSKGKICEKCTKGLRECNCLINNCTENYFASFSFSLRSFIIRKIKYYNNIDLFFPMSYFQKQKLIDNGFLESKIVYLPNSFSNYELENLKLEINKKKFIGFVGRLTAEKGFFDFITLAKKMPEFEFRVAGEKTLDIDTINIPQNVKFEGFLNKDDLMLFYQKCRVILFLSRWYEGFPLVLLESMFNYTPMIVNNLAVMPEVVENGIEGFVVQVGDLDLVEQRIGELFVNDEEYSQICYNCRKKVDDNYSSDLYYIRLMQEYKR